MHQSKIIKKLLAPGMLEKRKKADKHIQILLASESKNIDYKPIFDSLKGKPKIIQQAEMYGDQLIKHTDLPIVVARIILEYISAIAIPLDDTWKTGLKVMSQAEVDLLFGQAIEQKKSIDLSNCDLATHCISLTEEQRKHLRGANFFRVIFPKGMKLDGANLSNVKFIDVELCQASMFNVRFNKQTFFKNTDLSQALILYSGDALYREDKLCYDQLNDEDIGICYISDSNLSGALVIGEIPDGSWNITGINLDVTKSNLSKAIICTGHQQGYSYFQDFIRHSSDYYFLIIKNMIVSPEEILAMPNEIIAEMIKERQQGKDKVIEFSIYNLPISIRSRIKAFATLREPEGDLSLELKTVIISLLLFYLQAAYSEEKLNVPQSSGFFFNKIIPALTSILCGRKKEKVVYTCPPTLEKLIIDFRERIPIIQQAIIQTILELLKFLWNPVQIADVKSREELNLTAQRCAQLASYEASGAFGEMLRVLRDYLGYISLTSLFTNLCIIKKTEDKPASLTTPGATFAPGPISSRKASDDASKKLDQGLSHGSLELG